MSAFHPLSTRARVRSPAPLRVGCLAFAPSADIPANAEIIEQGIQMAGREGVQVLLTPEAALTGYPGGGRDDLEAVDWPSVASREDALAEKALELGLVLILGSGSLIDAHVTNDALLCGAVGRERRYRKRCLTPWDHEHYVPGDTAVVADVAGWRIGLAICFDIRFPDVWADLAEAKADLFCCLAHLAGSEPDPCTKGPVIAAHLASRSGEWATPLVLCNTAHSDRWLDSGFWDARGLRCGGGASGLVTGLVKPRQAHGPWYGTLRETALDRWHARMDDNLS
ncbi:MAG: carbon-nitrogen hydrolase family protein [Planctomycetota bacterium]